MASFSAAWRRWVFRSRSIYCAARARSAKLKFTGWARSGLAAVQKKTEFFGNLNVSSRC
ncbi:MAG: hypothetical protein ACI9LZ_003759, partial [Glaciecola sp.]